MVLIIIIILFFLKTLKSYRAPQCVVQQVNKMKIYRHYGNSRVLINEYHSLQIFAPRIMLTVLGKIALSVNDKT